MITPKLDNGRHTISIDLVGVTQEEALRYEETLGVLISQGVLGLHDGKAILSFDYEGRIREINFDFKKWRKKKDEAGV